MATNNIAAAPNPYADDQLAIDRRRRIAEALSEQSAEPMSAGGMVGNVYVGPSWTQGLAKLFQGYVGGQAMKAADQQQRELNQRRMGNYSRTMSDVTKALMGGQTPGPVVENQPGDPMLAHQIAMNSGDPMVMQNLGTLLQLQRDMRPSLKFHNAGGEVFVVDDKTGQITKMPMAPTPGEMRQQDEFKYRVNQDQWNANNLSLSQATEAQARNAEADAARETAYFNTGRRASPLPTVPPFVPRPAWNPQTGFGASPPVAPVQAAPAAQPSQPRAAVPPQSAAPVPPQAVGRAPVATPAPAKAAGPALPAMGNITPKQRTEIAKELILDEAKRRQNPPPPTEGQGKDITFAARMLASNREFEQLAKQGVVMGSLGNRVADTIPLVGGAVRMATNAFASPEQQRVEQAQRDFINAVLRDESGATIQPAEFANAQQQYFPQPNDSPDVIARKAASRQAAIEGMMTAAGPMYTQKIQEIADKVYVPLKPKDKPKDASTQGGGGWKVERVVK